MGNLTIDFKFSLSGQESLHFIKCSQFVVKYSFYFSSQIADLLQNGGKIRLCLLSAEEKHSFALLIWSIFVRCFPCIFHLATKMYPQMVVAAIKLHYPGEQLQKESLEFANDFCCCCFGKSLLLGEALSLRYGQVLSATSVHFSEILVGLILLPFERMNKIKVLPSFIVQ